MKNLTGPIIALHFMRHNRVVIDARHGLIHFPHLTMQSKRCNWSKRQTCPYSGQHNSTTEDNKNDYSICWPPIWMAHNNYCDTSGKIYRSSESANIPVNFNNNWEKDCSPDHKHNGITIFNKEKHTNCWILRSYSGAIQVHQTGRHSNSQSDSGRWSRSDYLSEWNTQNK